MSYTNAEGRQEVLDVVGAAIDDIGRALAGLGDAYELLDEHTADRLEENLFRPVQAAYGRAQRLHAEFAERYGLPGRTFQPASASAPSIAAKLLVERAMDAVGAADDAIAGLQDSMLPVEVGDPELRAALVAVRDLLGGLRARSRELVRTFGR